VSMMWGLIRCVRAYHALDGGLGAAPEVRVLLPRGADGEEHLYLALRQEGHVGGRAAARGRRRLLPPPPAGRRLLPRRRSGRSVPSATATAAVPLLASPRALRRRRLLRLRRGRSGSVAAPSLAAVVAPVAVAVRARVAATLGFIARRVPDLPAHRRQRRAAPSPSPRRLDAPWLGDTGGTASASAAAPPWRHAGCGRAGCGPASGAPGCGCWSGGGDT